MIFEQWPIGRLVPYARNPRKNDSAVVQMASAIREFGFRIPIVAKSNGDVVDGHLRLKAAVSLGLETVPVVLADDLSEAQIKAFRLLANQSTTWADWDNEMLNLELDDLLAMGFDLELTGFEQAAIDALTPEEIPVALTEDDAVPEPPKEAITKPGDVWVLGDHRLICGDSTSLDTVQKLLGSDAVALVFTDPPYGVSYSDKSKNLNARTGSKFNEGHIENDSLKPKELYEFLLNTFTTMFAVIPAGAAYYVCSPQGGEMGRAFLNALKDAGLGPRHQIAWVKNQFVLGRSDYHYKHEQIIYDWKEGAAHSWYGGRDKTSVWEVDKPESSKLHPTMKPVALVEIALENSSKKSDVVLDLFGGSGSTMIACEKLGRRSRLSELSPRYCDVIVKRWEEHTEKKAVLS